MMSRTQNPVRYEHSSGPVARIVLADPNRRNALTSSMCSALCEAFRRADADEGVRVIVLCGEAPAFCSGGDIKAMSAQEDIFAGPSSQDIMDSYRATIQRLPQTIMSIAKPIVAEVDGPAIGAGFDLACFCDLRVVSTRAKFAESFGHLGLISGIGGAFALTRLTGLGYAVAADLTLTGRVIGGEEAYRLGLASRLCDATEIKETTQAICDAIVSQPAAAVAGAKRLLRHAMRGELEDHLAFAASLQSVLHLSEAHRERLRVALAPKK